VRMLGGIAGILLVAVLLIVFLPRIWSTLGTGSVSNTDPTSSPFVQATNGSTSSQSDIDLSPSQNSNLNSATDTPTRIISATKKPTRTELPRKVCPGAPPIRVEIGDDAIVTYNCGDHVLMRLNPVVATNAEQYLYAGDRLKIIDGPRCSNDVTFFLVEAPKYSKTGWVAEALADSDTYCVDLVP
jgi:hypothetical protein